MKLSKRSLANLQSVDPLLIAIMVDSIKDSPYDYGIPSTGGVRTDEEQHKLFLDGKSKCDGYDKKSKHQPKELRGMKIGKAVDFYGYVNGGATWDTAILTAIARHIQKVAKDRYNINLTWGGDWKSFRDMPHLQL